MNLLASIYTVLMFITLGLGRKPWFYGLDTKNSMLKSKSTRCILMAMFSAHTVVALWWATQTYLKLLH